ncbi:MAG TPA: CinA family protein [Azospirillaceae bacterium]|nr:CinA family protein [Azospirillaceae bacterium]
MLPDDITDLAAHVLDLFKAEGARIATAESCTGGLIAGALTEVAGSSAVVDRGFVTYSNEAKNELLGVPVALIAQHGAVSQQVAQAMAEGALARSQATVAVAVTGIAGPTGGSPAKPVGLVYFAVAKRDAATVVERHVFPGDRSLVRAATVRKALDLLAGAAP